MRRTVLPVAMAVLVSGLPVSGQPGPSTSCRWLTVAEASEVIGAGATLTMAVVDGACVYVRGPLFLQIAQPARLHDEKALRLGFDSMKKHRKGQDEDGIGDSAFVAHNEREIAFVKGNAFVVVTVEGEGAQDRLVALKDAVRKIAARF